MAIFECRLKSFLTFAILSTLGVAAVGVLANLEMFLSILSGYCEYPYSYMPLIQMVAFSLISMLLVYLFILASGSLFSKIILQNSAVTFLGSISYGMYLYHPVVFGWFMTNNESVVVITQIIPAYLSTICVSYLSYRFIEMPGLKFKHRFDAIQTS